MRFLLYNIRYGTGGKRRLPWSGYLSHTTSNVQQITRFIESVDPDIAGLVEVDAGSYRHRRRCQAETIASALGHYHIYQSKYGLGSMAQRFPLLNKQGNAFLTRDTFSNEQFHYFDRGLKRLVIELELESVVVFLVHLAITPRVRHDQLSDLYTLVTRTEKPYIVAGDFNTLWGDREIGLFLAATGLNSANEKQQPSFPSRQPKRQLDFVLYSTGIRLTGFDMPKVTFSDHLPLVCDFEPS